MKTARWVTAAILLGAGAGAYALVTLVWYALKAPVGQDKSASIASAPTIDLGEGSWAVSGEHHRILVSRVGHWELTYMVGSPDLPPNQITGSSVMEMVSDGRFLEETIRGQLNGAPFECRRFTGYDRVKGQYRSTWADNISTDSTLLNGTWDSASKAFTFNGEMTDLRGKSTQGRVLEKMGDKDNWASTFVQLGPHGKETILLEIIYSRANERAGDLSCRSPIRHQSRSPGRGPKRYRNPCFTLARDLFCTSSATRTWPVRRRVRGERCAR